MKRHGYGILYLKGNISPEGKQIAGSIIMKDTSFDGSGGAEFLTPPNPEGMFEMLKSLEERIQIASSTTFILPKDINMSGDISGIAIQLTQSGDNEKAKNLAIEWQDAINQATYLFKEGLSKELVNKGIMAEAATEFPRLLISAKFVPWMPKSLTETAQVLNTLVASNITSTETAVENMMAMGVNKPSEKQRLRKEQEQVLIDNAQIQQGVSNENTSNDVRND